MTREDRAWRFAAEPSHLALLDGLAPDDGWNGPLIVSMPRTGSTLLGTVFLLLRDDDGEPAFDRYLHEPVSPVFWESKPVESILQVTGERLTHRDIVQESAYQFAAREIAGWFLRRARQPIGFAIRHPQLAWPSRWRIMLQQRLTHDPAAAGVDRWRTALETDDFTELGTFLTTQVVQPDNGCYSFMSLLDLCEEEEIEYVIVDNARFRREPARVLSRLCDRWGLDLDPAMTDWRDLTEALPRVVMSELASGPEYEWYYAGTLGSTEGIIREDRQPLPLHRFPEVLRGESDEHFTIDDAVAWYESLLAHPATL